MSRGGNVDVSGVGSISVVGVAVAMAVVAGCNGNGVVGCRSCCWLDNIKDNFSKTFFCCPSISVSRDLISHNDLVIGYKIEIQQIINKLINQFNNSPLQSWTLIICTFTISLEFLTTSEVGGSFYIYKSEAYIFFI